jgi:hypothetical protein
MWCVNRYNPFLEVFLILICRFFLKKVWYFLIKSFSASDDSSKLKVTFVESDVLTN